MTLENVDTRLASTYRIANATRALRTLSHMDVVYQEALDMDYIWTVQRHGMRGDWRETLVYWFQSYGVTCGLSFDCVTKAINFLDRFCSKVSCNEHEFKVAAVGCLWIASKCAETQSLKVADCVAAAEGKIDKDAVVVSELNVLATLTWQLNPPGVEPVVDACIALWAPPGPAADAVAATAKLFALRARRDYECLRFSDALVGVTATLGALREHNVSAAAAHAWMARVEAARLPYMLAPDAGALQAACGRRICALCAPHRLLPDPGQYRGPPPATPERPSTPVAYEESEYEEPSSVLSDMDASDDELFEDRESPTDVTDDDIHTRAKEGLAPGPPELL